MEKNVVADKVVADVKTNATAEIKNMSTTPQSFKDWGVFFERELFFTRQRETTSAEGEKRTYTVYFLFSFAVGRMECPMRENAPPSRSRSKDSPPINLNHGTTTRKKEAQKGNSPC